MNFWDLETGETIYLNVGVEVSKDNFYATGLQYRRKYSRSCTVLSLNNGIVTKGFFKKKQVSQGEIRVQFENGDIQAYTEDDWTQGIISYEPLFKMEDEPFFTGENYTQVNPIDQQMTEQVNLNNETKCDCSEGNKISCDTCPYMQFFQKQQALLQSYRV